jgi:protein O-mannosyl-transferase
MIIIRDWKRNSSIHILILLVAIAIAYSKILGAGFMSWDDAQYVLDNKDIHCWHNFSAWFQSFYIGNYHPLTMFSYAIDYAIGGNSPVAYHATNIALHAASAVLLYFLVIRLFEKKEIGLLVALLFAMHPVQTESVSWIAERKNVLYGFFFLLSLWYYVGYATEDSNKKMIGVILAGIAAMLSKGAAVTLPLTFFAIDIWLQRPLKDRKIWLEKLPLLAAAIITGIIALQAQKQGGFLGLHPEYGLGETIVYGGYAYTAYIFHLLVPVHLSVLYPYPQAIGAVHIFYTIIAVAMLALVWLAYRKQWYVLCGGIVFYTINIALVLQWVQFGEVLMADRYLYIASIGIWIPLAWHVVIWLKHSVKVIVITVVALALTAFTFVRNDIWLSELNFWQAVVDTFPASSVAQNSIGGVYMKMGDYPKALQHIDAAVDADARNYKAWYNKGAVHLRRAEKNEALNAFNKAIEVQLYSKALFSRALLFQQSGEPQRAMNDIEKVLEQEPANARAYYIKGSCMGQLNNMEGAVANYTRAIEYDGHEPLFFASRGLVFMKTGKDFSALTDFSNAISLKNDYAEAWYWRGIVKHNMGKDPCGDLNEARKLGSQEAIEALVRICNTD